MVALAPDPSTLPMERLVQTSSCFICGDYVALMQGGTILGTYHRTINLHFGNCWEAFERQVQESRTQFERFYGVGKEE